jgi:hypothetical protein
MTACTREPILNHPPDLLDTFDDGSAGPDDTEHFTALSRTLGVQPNATPGTVADGHSKQPPVLLRQFPKLSDHQRARTGGAGQLRHGGVHIIAQRDIHLVLSREARHFGYQLSAQRPHHNHT